MTLEQKYFIAATECLGTDFAGFIGIGRESKIDCEYRTRRREIYAFTLDRIQN